jgi:hypothetical protein
MLFLLFLVFKECGYRLAIPKPKLREGTPRHFFPSSLFPFFVVVSRVRECSSCKFVYFILYVCACVRASSWRALLCAAPPRAW